MRASFRGEVIHGKGGNDVLMSLFNRTELYGDSGNDRLKTTLDRREDTAPVTLSGTLSGGTGNDDLMADFYGLADDVTIAATLDGGDGDDKITSELAASTYVSGVVESNISAGAGRDTITASISMEGIPSEEDRGTNRIDAGDGDDIVKASVYADFTGDRTYATNRIDGGLGNDRIEADAFINAGGGFYARNVISWSIQDDSPLGKVD
jgi:Ca2+-binding RTX toxin-like protein